VSVRVAGCDPGTTSLDVVALADGAVVAQIRFSPDEIRNDPEAAVRWLVERGPFDLVAGPSGYGLPLVRAAACTPQQRALMTLVRPDDADASGVGGFTELVEAFCRSSLPVVFLPGVVHLPTVPAHRKLNRIDLGTADKVCAVALALTQRPAGTFCLLELGSAFTACVAVERGRIVDGSGGTSGAMGWRSAGAWDGEAAYLLSPLTKHDLFRGGVCDVEDKQVAQAAFRESAVKAVAALRAVTPFDEVILSGRLRETEPDLVEQLAFDLASFVMVGEPSPLPAATAKHAAQGAAVIADGLAGGRWAELVRGLELHDASGTALDHLVHPRRHSLS
jgi:predicted butyrate kinase (DUF1464 family)